MKILEPLSASDLAHLSAADRPHGVAWNTLVSAAQRRAGAPLRWTRQSRDWGELTIDWDGRRETIFGTTEADALRRYLGLP